MVIKQNSAFLSDTIKVVLEKIHR